MPEVAVLIRVKVDPVDVPNLKEYRLKNSKALKRAVPGFKSLSIWQADNDPKRYMILFIYDGEESADEGLQVSMDQGPLIESLKKTANSPEVRRGWIKHSDGPPPGSLPVGSLASVSFRVAEPGMGKVLQSELATIFSELTVIEGYVGSMTCQNETLNEEVIGIVFWDRREAFEASLPSKVFYEVLLFKRIY